MTIKQKGLRMSYVKIKTEHEEAIAMFCAANDRDFNVATAYKIVAETFKDHPIKQKSFSEDTGKMSTTNITLKVARAIECSPHTVDRIAAKVEYAKDKLNKRKFELNIQNAANDYCPDLDKLVDNLYQLNIVDEQSYLALVCFLMQLKYSRDNQVQGNDKTCVFFNGVARNGKTATASAICDVESQYGIVFKPQSGKILESTHEERIWKSHLNLFDEVKPSDVDRELLLTIVNGGEVEINPKNKKPYIFNSNTNNMFTSNGVIPFKQRRISVIKFGNRIDAPCLAEDILQTVIKNIFDSLPDHNQYYTLYNIVSKNNESCITDLAIQDILTFLNKRIGYIQPDKENVLAGVIKFTAHRIYSCIKDTYNKQILTSERKAAIRATLENMEKEGRINQFKYPSCSTMFYEMTIKAYYDFLEYVGLPNTNYENNHKISKDDLRDKLSQFFPNIESKAVENTQKENNKKEQQ